MFSFLKLFAFEQAPLSSLERVPASFLINPEELQPPCFVFTMIFIYLMTILTMAKSNCILLLHTFKKAVSIKCLLFGLILLLRYCMSVLLLPDALEAILFA